VMSPRMLVCVLVILSTLFNAIKADVPIAMHQLVVVPQASNSVIRLKGFDGTTKPGLVYTVAKPWLTGSLYQLSQVYSNHNIEPKMGTAITSSENVTGSNNRVYYTRPNPDMTTGKLVSCI
jgi:hypothetical protein